MLPLRGDGTSPRPPLLVRFQVPNIIFLPARGSKISFAGGLGIEPRLIASKATVLPLDDPPMLHNLTHNKPPRLAGAV